MTNDWVQGHLAAINDTLKTVHDCIMRDKKAVYEYDADEDEMSFKYIAFEEIEIYLKDKKQSLKELVDKLNKQAEKK